MKIDFSRKGFTLVELVVIVALFALVLSLGISSVGCQARENARQDSCRSMLINLGKAIIMYGDPNKGYIPTWDDPSKHTMATNDNRLYGLNSKTKTPGNKLLLGGYMGMNSKKVTKDMVSKTFRCPSDKKNFNGKNAASYIYMPLLDESEDAKRRMIIGRDNPGAALVYDIHSALTQRNTGGAAKLPAKGGNHPSVIQILYFGGHDGAIEVKKGNKITFHELDQIIY